LVRGNNLEKYDFFQREKLLLAGFVQFSRVPSNGNLPVAVIENPKTKMIVQQLRQVMIELFPGNFAKPNGISNLGHGNLITNFFFSLE
jgi:hypothetical protein